ncbi:cytochrome ubiquinol oxidase subunit II [Pigmentiphaga litoralis]|uniref:cytochrome ubiquinol oxidase subunit II n=1 Tax=Pigmentiphaga litoralis TaxID=516702 RepID=UPI003B42CBB7
MLLNATVIMLMVIVPVIVLVIGCAWWFRAGNARATRRPEWNYSGPVEITIWAIPLLVVLFLGGIAWLGSHDLDPRRPLAADPPPLDIQVVSLDWKWLFLYPGEGVAAVNHLIVPIGRPLRLHLTSASVMNSFFVPQLGSQIYTMAGMVTQLHLQADHAGTFTGMSAQFSGEGFSDMRFGVEALPEADYAAWIARTARGSAVFDAHVYRELSAPGSHPRQDYRLASTGLFDAIVGGNGVLDAAAPPPAPSHMKDTKHGKMP